MSIAIPTARLVEVAELNPPLAESLSDGEQVAFLPMSAVNADLVSAVDRETRLYSEVSKGYTPFLDGDVLVAKITPCFENGKIALATLTCRHGFGSTEFHVVRPRPGCTDARYLAYFLRQGYVRRQGETRMTGSAGQRRVPQHFLAGLSVPVPPLLEQRRIAGILHNADALRIKRRSALSKLDALTQSIFLEMFGDPASNPRGWPVRTFGDLFEISSSKRVLESQWKKEGVPFYRAREIVKLAEKGYVTNELFISEDLFNSFSEGRDAPKEGDLMVSAVGTLGACYQVRSGDRFYFKDASVLRFSPKENVESAFVRHAFMTDHVLRQVHSGSGSTVGTYTIARARQTRLYAPPVALQRRFAQVAMRVHSQGLLFSNMLNQFDTLFNSLQHRAFRGEL